MFTDQHSTIIEQDALTELVGFVWETLTHQELTPCAPLPLTEAVFATISIGGPCMATLEVAVTSRLARQFAAELLGQDSASLDDEDIDDAIGELANVVGGNVKGLLDDGVAATLSLPVVSHAAPSVTGGHLTALCGFLAAGEPMIWSLFERQ